MVERAFDRASFDAQALVADGVTLDDFALHIRPHVAVARNRKPNKENLP